MQRRSILQLGGLFLTGISVGCTQPNGDGESPTAGPTRTATPTRTRTETETSPPRTETTEQPTDSPAEETATQTEEPTRTTAVSPDHTIRVGPNSSLRFDPGQLTLATGDTVQWIWDAGGHNVRPDTNPEGAEWPGTPGGDGTTYDEGYTYQYTFTVTGDYAYYCAPHRSVGMTGTLTVE